MAATPRREWPRVPAGAETYSVSALRDWECLFRGKRKRIDKAKEPLGAPLHEGRILHDVCAAYVRHCIAAGVDTDLTAIPSLVRETYWDPETDEPHSLPAEHVVETQRTARGWAEGYIVDRPHTTHIEEIWLLPFAPAGANTHLWVICDHVLMHEAGRVAVIRDLKSDRHLRSVDDVARDLQVWVYCWAVAQKYPMVQEFRVEMDFLRHGIVRQVEFGREIVDQAEEILVDSIARIRGYRKRKTFPAVAGDGCRYCGFRAECPLLQKLADPGVLVDAAAAEHAAEQLVALEARVAGLKSQLSDWTAVNGPVEVGGVEWGHHLSVRDVVRDPRALVAALESLGLSGDAWRALRVDARGLDRLRRSQRASDAIGPLLEDASHTEFRVRKAGAADVGGDARC